MHLVPGNLVELLEQQSAEVKSAPSPAGWWTLWKGEKAVRHMVCVHLAWSIYIVTYYGMLLNIRTFSREHLEINTVVAGEFIGDLLIEDNFFIKKYLFFDCSALCEIAGVFVGLLLILHTERKWLYSGVMNIIGAFVACFVWIVPGEST